MQRIILLFVTITSLTFGFTMGLQLSKSKQPAMKRVTSIGGIFFKCKDPSALKQWYNKHLGLQTDQYGTNFEWHQGSDSTKKGFTQWSPFGEKSKYFEPSTKEFMINYRVENLEWLVAELKKRRYHHH